MCSQVGCFIFRLGTSSSRNGTLYSDSSMISIYTGEGSQFAKLKVFNLIGEWADETELDIGIWEQHNNKIPICLVQKYRQDNLC